ncbi:UvrD-helicase domain-containing protein [Peptoniphilus equinus]|uniref:DNA 3'-5' helicase n=1 Tax=Peptoniphilus equinus TaxID=3016343 RepID=A0ABY7QU72_9FIRM|nr:UvrD-helicase domain-containing protein [Peptoniphilus equinus]WBW49570.1 UvrD-helicase domain-containing protein [Peptoniphilus equinus]
MNLNPIQQQAVDTLDRDVVLLAGAGTGKTAVLTARYLKLLRRGVSPEAILAITFTNKAQEDMVRKIKAALEAEGMDRRFISRCHIYTIHGMAKMLIDTYPETTGRGGTAIVEEQEAVAMLRQAVKRVLRDKRDHPTLQALLIERGDERVETLAEDLIGLYFQLHNDHLAISELKALNEAYLNRGRGDWGGLKTLLDTYAGQCGGKSTFLKFYNSDEAKRILEEEDINGLMTVLANLGTNKKAADTIAAIEGAVRGFAGELERQNQAFHDAIVDCLTEADKVYSEMKLAQNVVDFNDLERLGLEVLTKEPVCFDYVMVDEFQDTSPIQVALLDALKANNPGLNRFIVGDGKQSIYAFRGGSLETFEAYSRRLVEEGALELELTENYRTNAALMADFNDLFAPILPYHPLTPAVQGNGGITPFADDEKVYETVASLIQQGVAPESIALLFRKTALMGEVQARFRDMGIDAVNTATAFAEGRNVHDVLIALKAVVKDDILTKLSFYKLPAFGMSESDIFLLGKGYRDYGILDGVLLDGAGKERFKQAQDTLDELRRLKHSVHLSDLVARTVVSLKLYEKNSVDAMAAATAPQDDAALDKLYTFAHTFEQDSGDILNFVRAVEAQRVDVQSRPGAVNLVTIHKSKGLEYDYVFLMEAGASYMTRGGSHRYNTGPDGLAVNGTVSLKFNDNKRRAEMVDQEEARRLFYVALTRGKKHCFYVHPDKPKKHSFIDFFNLSGFDHFSDEVIPEASAQAQAPIETERRDLRGVFEHTVPPLVEYFSATLFIEYQKDREAFFQNLMDMTPTTTYSEGGAHEVDPLLRGSIMHSYAQFQPRDHRAFIEERLHQAGIEPTPSMMADFEKLIETYSKADADILDREWEFYYPLGRGIIHGFIDRIEATEGGVVIADLKTGRVNASRLPHYTTQLEIYAYCYAKITGTCVKGLKIIALDEDKTFQVPLDWVNIEQTMEQFENFINAVLNYGGNYGLHKRLSK